MVASAADYTVAVRHHPWQNLRRIPDTCHSIPVLASGRTKYCPPSSLEPQMMKILLTAIATISLVAAPLAQTANRSGKIAVYAAVGEELITFGADVDQTALTRQSSVTLPGFVQEAWASPSTPFLYVAWSNGGTSYAGSGVAPVGGKHGVTAFRVDSSGALHVQGPPASLRSRPIHITG